MRAVFTIGVLDYFMDAGITFPMASACRPERGTACRI